MASTSGPTIGLLWRGDTSAPPPRAEESRFSAIFEAFAARNAAAVPVVYGDEIAVPVQARLLEMDAVLVWVDPIVSGEDRSILDVLLREVADAGVFVSAHPDVILRMGTKEVLHRTRDLAWGTDTHVYRTLDDLRARLLPHLKTGPRVLKQDRGSGGNGVWKLEMLRDAPQSDDAFLRVQPAEREAVATEMRLVEFIEQRAEYFRYFEGQVCFVDQPYAERLGEGMTRVYLVHDRVAGFGHQYVTALMPAPPGADGPPPPSPRLYYGPDKPEFQHLRRLLESGWIAEMQRVLSIDRESLPVIWDADFLLGPRTPDGEDSYLLCEVNVSGVFPIPDESIPPLVDAAIERAQAAKHARRR